MTDTVAAVATFKLLNAGSDTFFDGKILSFEKGEAVVAVDQTPLDQTTGGRIRVPGRLKDWTLTGTLIGNPKDLPPVGATGTLEIVYADTAPATKEEWSGCFIQNYGVPFEVEEGIVSTFEFAMSGDVTRSTVP